MQKVTLKDKKLRTQRTRKFNIISSADKNEYQILLYSLYLKTTKGQCTSSYIEDSEIYLFLNAVMTV
jgi:hypothetical protein